MDTGRGTICAIFAIYLVWEDTLEEGMATHSSILAWRIPWSEEPGRLQSRALQGVRQNWSDLACTHAQVRRWVTAESHSDLASGQNYHVESFKPPVYLFLSWTSCTIWLVLMICFRHQKFRGCEAVTENNNVKEVEAHGIFIDGNFKDYIVHFLFSLL